MSVDPDERLSAVEKTIDLILTHLENQEDSAGVSEAPSEKGGTAPWLHAQGPEATATELAVWVKWLFDAYRPALPADVLPTCWAEHPGLVAELLTLWHCWQAAFLDPEASPEAAQNWHDRWLPGFLSRIPRWTPGSCINGKHKPSQ